MNADKDGSSDDVLSCSSSTVSEIDSDETLENDSTICSLCEATDRPTTDIQDCQELKSIKEYIESTSSKVRKVKFACQTCLYKLYTVIDQNRLKAFRQERQQRLAKVAGIAKSADPTESPASEEADKEVPSATIHTFDANDLFPPKVLPPEAENSLLEDSQVAKDHSVVNEPFDESIAIIDVHGNSESDYEHDVSRRSENLLKPSTASPIPAGAVPASESSSQSHLDVMYEQTESAIITESGGTVEQHKTSLQCSFCAKEFILSRAYNKHMRTHHSKLLSTRSAPSSRGRSTPHNAVYECADCLATFDSSSKLKTHRRIHLKRYYCTYCHKESLSQYDHDFHEAECRGSQMAQEEFVETRRMTRSISRSLYSVPDAAGDAKSERYSDSRSQAKRPRSRKSSAVRSKYVDDYDEDEDDDDDDDGATSVAYTDYTQLNMDVAKWVAGTCRSRIGSTSVKSFNISDCHTADDLQGLRNDENTPPIFFSQKEYDIIMLERLILQTESNVYICCFLNCDYITNTLREMCLHEILIHKLKTYYYCHKCKGVFTSKLYLDYHLHLQNFGEYQCHKCSMRFNFEYLLQYHLIQHQKYDSFPCLLCGNSFMSIKDLRLHCLQTGHDPKKRKKLITIDPTMSIVNETPPEPPPPKRTHKTTINIMNLPKTPSLQSRTNLKRPKGRRIFLGEIDFVYQLGLNCVRTN